MSRAETLKAQGRDLVLPVNPAPYITDWLLEIGPTAPAGDGSAPIGFSEMAEWSRIMGVELSPWEARTLRRLSLAYVNQREEARNPTCIEPMCKGDPEVARERVEQQFEAMMKSLKRGV